MGDLNDYKNGCQYGWHDGSCCCNCINQKKLMKHPMNRVLGKGNISDQMGYVCVVELEDNESNKGNAVFHDYLNEHGMCELYCKK